jgi:NAD(P)H-hydrate epimerase
MSSSKEINKNFLKKVYKKRKQKSSKGDYGKLVIIGGNEKYSGAPVLNSLAAMSSLKSGVDIVEVVGVKRVVDTIASFSPDLITFPLKGKYLSKKHLKKVIQESQNKTGFVLGGGIGRKQKTLVFVRKFLEITNLRGVIDADGIHALKNRTMNLEKFVLTSHSGEFFVLTGKRVDKNLKNRIKIVQKEAKRLGTTILLKGDIDIISNGKENVLNRTGNAYMTVGGTGDVLAGVTGSLISQGNLLFDSACAAAYIVGKAGENLKKKRSLIASDLLEEIGKIVDSI